MSIILWCIYHIIWCKKTNNVYFLDWWCNNFINKIISMERDIEKLRKLYHKYQRHMEQVTLLLTQRSNSMHQLNPDVGHMYQSQQPRYLLAVLDREINQAMNRGTRLQIQYYRLQDAFRQRYNQEPPTLQQLN